MGRILGDFIFRRSRAIQWTAVAMALGSIFLLPRVRFDANPLSLQDPSTPAFQVYESLFDDPTKSPWTAKVVATSEEEAEAIAKNLKNEALVSDVVWVNTFLPPNQKERLAWLKQVTGRSYPALEVKDLPQDLRSRYLSDTGLYRLEVFPKENLNDIEAMRRFSDVVLKVAPNATDDPITIPATADAIVRSFMVAGILALCLTLFILFTALRNWVDTLLALLPLVLGGLYTVAFMQIIGSDFNFANIIVLPLLMGIAMDSGIHVIHKYRQSVKENPIAGSTSRALFFSAIVNISSFGTLAIANHRGMASMGLLLSVGMTLMLSCTFVVLPAMLKNLHRVRRQYLSAA